MGWIYLLLAGLFEIGFTTSLRHIDWSFRPLPIVSFLVFTNASFVFLWLATHTVPLGTAYAVWTGIGAAGTVLVGIYFYGEATTTLRLVFLIALIGSIIGLKLVGGG